MRKLDISKNRTNRLSSVLFNRLSTRLALAVLLFSFFMPPKGIGIDLCLYKNLFGLPCPGCGLLRSISSISHFHLKQALHYNPFGLVIYPLFLFLALFNFLPGKSKARIESFMDKGENRKRVYYLSGIYLFIGFGIIRTLYFLLK